MSTFDDFMIDKAVKDDANLVNLRTSNRNMLDAPQYALECLTRPDDVDVVYRMTAIQKIKAAIRGDQ